MKNVDVNNWPVNRFLMYKGWLYFPLALTWPIGQPFGTLHVKLIGSVQKLQKGPSTDIIPLDSQNIKIQVSNECGIANEGLVGNGKSGGEGESTPNGGGDVGILDGSRHEGGSGAETGNTTVESVAIVPTSVGGPGGGVGEATQGRQEKDEGGLAAGGGPEATEQKNPEPGKGPRSNERPGEAIEGAAG